ncbi:MAG TPA: hypothetical protein VHY37_12095 [Tepidisphaeraceae bacterium]|jgi:hypothetical protein|nr:hypothetical protein [Tepidisphaeraceae bacterium]
MSRYFLIAAFLFVPPVLLAQPPTAVPATAPAADAYPLYEKAANLLHDYSEQRHLWSPASSNLQYPHYPPFSDAWMSMEKTDYDGDAMIRELVHKAAAVDRADWPAVGFRDKVPVSRPYLGECRALANELADAATYQSIYLKNQPAAFQTLNDSEHMAELLGNQPGPDVIRDLVADAIIALDTEISNIIVSGISIANDPANHHDLPIATARRWIERLMDHPTPEARLDTLMSSAFRLAREQNSPFKTKQQYVASPKVAPTLPGLLKVLRLTNAERDLAAMSLAAHLYRFHHHRWPADIQELATELPSVPIDPFGDGKQTLGYVLIPRGLPDGGHRPLVYSRDNSKDGLFYRTDYPEYDRYFGDGSKAPWDKQKQGGQFRDVARWVPPKANPGPGPATRPIGP